MRKARVFVPVAIFAMLIGVWGGTQLTAFASRGGHTNAIKAGARPAHATTVTTHGAPKKTYVEDQIEANIPVGSSFTPIGNPIHASCPGTTGKCTLEMQGGYQICYGASGDYYYLELEVDGVLEAISPYSGQFNTQLCDTRTWTWIQTGVLHGVHTVQFGAQASGSTAEVSDYSHVVRLYKP